MKKLVLAAAVAVAVAFPTSAFAGTFSGVVVGKSAGTLAVAAKSGAVRTVHSRAHVRIGERVSVTGAVVRAIGVAHRARIHGVVVQRVHGVTFIAAGRSLLAVRASGRRLAGLAPTTGAIVNTNVAIGSGQLTQQSMQVVGHDDRVTIQVPITAVGPGTITVSVNGRPLTLRLPDGIQLPASLVGQTVTLTVKVEDENDVVVENEPAENEPAENEANDDNDQGGDDGDHGGHGGGDDGDG
jgi:hypothetical protein